MEQVNEIFNLLGDAVTSIVLPLLGVLLFYDSRKRNEAAKAKLAEAEARKVEEENLSARAEEWRKLYEEERNVEKELNAKIDKLDQEKNDDRQRIRELQEKNMKLTLELQAANFMRCEIKKCTGRQPPTGY